MEKNKIIKVLHLTKKYQTIVLNDINLEIEKGQMVGVVGESGAGKSTLGKIISGWEKASKGEIQFYGKEVQYICQNPYSAVNPKFKIEKIIEEPWVIQKIGTKIQRKEKVKELLRLVGLQEEQRNYFPEQLSGGQLQRVIIARSLMLNPDLLVADEITASLDVSVQKQIMKLLWKLNKEKNMACLLISHDLELVRHMCDKIIILNHGNMIESGSPEQLWKQPKHPDTKEMIQSILI